MSTRNELRGAPAEEPNPNEVLRKRSTERLRRLLPNDPELQLARPSAEALEAIRGCGTTIESLAKAFEVYADRPCLAERAFEPATEGLRLLPEFRKVRFRDVWRRVEAFASGLAHEKLAETGAFVGICGFGSVDWVVADFACVYLAAVSAPLQTGMSQADLQQIIREAELSCMVCSVEQLDLIESVLPECPSLRNIVVMDLREGDHAAEAKVSERTDALVDLHGGRVSVHMMKDIEARGLERGILPKVLPSARGEPNPLMTLMYTSGSTGTPKGAMLTESILNEQWHSGFFTRLAKAIPDLPMITLNYMPLNHAAGRGVRDHAILSGGITYFVAKSDMSTLSEDIRLARPTSLLLVPRVAGIVYQHFQGEIVRRTAGISAADEREKIADRIMMEMRASFLGDRILLATLGSAPTPPEVVSFLRRCFDVPVIDGYGSTEAGPLTVDDVVDADVVMQWKLMDVPELGYRTTDQPYPRGELHVKTRFLVPGYYKNERATKELFDEDGFLNMGDIVEQRGPSELHWIDRAKNVLKLAQGEYVATSRLEGLYSSRSSFIRQMYVYGNGLRSYLLAVAVPDLEAANAYLRQRGVEPDDAALKQLVRSEVNRIALEESLRGYEIPRDFIIERQPFTYENWLLTASNKQSRPKLRARYGERLEALYDEIERAQLKELHNLQGAGAKASVAEKVGRAIEATLGLPDIDAAHSAQSFIQLGGDSLNAVSLETLIEDITGVHVPVGFLLDPTSNVRSLIAFVEDALSGKERRNVTFEDVDGPGSKTVRVDDLRIEKFLAPEEIEAARRGTPRYEVSPRAEVALLTGANGFLGRFLALELLERLAAEGTRLYAIVRAPNDAAAFERLARSYQTDPSLVARFQELSANGRLRVLAGDLMKARFGLAKDVYARLTNEVDLVLHNGALVNHAFSYEQLFEPNVLGTIEAIRLALTGRPKSLAYISTVGALMGLTRTEPVREDEDVRSLFSSPQRPIDSGYAVGYGTSKWASEVVLRDVHEKLGLPVTVYRPSGILAHSRYRGQVNVPDFFTRLLAGIVYTGVAPRSFYAENAPDHAKHYDGEPVDVVARSIAAPAVHRQGSQPRYETYHVVNPHYDDGISLDVIVSWLKSAGYSVERIPDYDAWYRTFHDRLMSLGEPQKQHSPLPILQAWQHPHGERELLFDASLLIARLRSISPEYGELPHVSEALIHKYLDDMAVQGLIAPPQLRKTGT
jgi:fatty acid CoA ligase FadD9